MPSTNEKLTSQSIQTIQVTPPADVLLQRWDSNASSRDIELGSNDDPSYRGLTNLILERIARLDKVDLSILDAGSGLGYLAAAIAEMGHTVVGIDPSVTSTLMASERHTGDRVRRLTFQSVSMEDFVKSNHNTHRFDVIVCNMTLHAVRKLPSFFSACARAMRSGGILIATIPNPDTYLQSRSDIDIANIDLRRDQIFEIPFRIHAHAPHPALVFYFHRVFRTYTDAAQASGMFLSDYRVPDQIGAGRARDIALLEFKIWPE